MKQTPQQFQIDLEPGLLEQFPEFRDVVHASVYSCGRAFKQIAADLDMSASELSRKLADNPNDPVHFPLKRLPELIRATGDLRPVHWLVAAFLETEETRRKRVVDDLTRLLPQIKSLLSSISTD